MFDAKFVESDSLLVGRLRGTLDAAVARKLVEFIEIKEEEHEKGSNRFCDMTQLERINLSVDDIASLAARRRAYNPNPIRVKSAFLVSSPLALGVVYMFRRCCNPSALRCAGSTHWKWPRRGCKSVPEYYEPSRTRTAVSEHASAVLPPGRLSGAREEKALPHWRAV